MLKYVISSNGHGYNMFFVMLAGSRRWEDRDGG